jgi:hypothetical protein
MRAWILAVALVCLLSLSARPQDVGDRDIGSKIHALENMWDQAQAQGDINALDLIFDNSMIYIDEDGSLLSKGEFLHRAAQEHGTNMQWVFSPTMSVKVYDGAAVVSGSYMVTGTRGGKRYQRMGYFIDTWALQNGVWLCVVAQSTPVLH